MMNVNELIANGKLEDAADVLFDVVLGIINQLSPKMHLTRDEWNKVAPKLIEKMQTPTSTEEKEKTPEPGDDIEILTETAVLTIKLVGPDDGFDAPAEITKNILVGTKYRIVPPMVVGYTPDKEVLEGTMTAEATTLTVNYTKVEEEEVATLKITYVGPADDSAFVAPAAVEQDVAVGEAYEVASPAVEGYTPDTAVVSGTMTADGKTVTVTYTKNA